jgi:sulfate adenylyltransferase subunit 1 (EFTu-like GTPase family)
MRKILSIGIAVLGGALGLSTLASAQATTPVTIPLSQDIKNDRADVILDKQAIDQMKQQEQADTQKLKADKKAGAGASQLAADRAALKTARQNLKNSRADVAKDKKNFNKDLRTYRRRRT